MSEGKRHQWAIIGIILLALTLRLTNLEGQSLWADEGITYARATLPWEEVVSNLLLVGNQTPIYYGLMRVWVRLAGISSFALRFPSVWMATLTVPVVYIIGKRARGRGTGLLAAALLALNPYHLWYAQEARMYALTILTAASMSVVFMEALRRPGWSWWVALGVISGAAYSVHYFTLAVSAAQFVVILANFRRLYIRFRRWAMVQILAALPTALWAINAVARRGTTRLGGGWIPRPSLLAPLYTFFNYSLGYERDPSTPLLLGYVLFLVAFALAFRTRARGRWRQMLLAWLVVPVGVTYLISLRRPLYVDRYLSVVVPAFVVWIALGVTSLRDRWRSFGAAALLAASVLAAVATVSGNRYQKLGWRSATRQVREEARPADQLFVANPTDIPVSHYYLEDTVALRVGTPERIAEGRAWFVYRVPIASNHLLGETIDFDLARDAEPEVWTWLRVHSDEIAGQWEHSGLALFLIETGSR